MFVSLCPPGDFQLNNGQPLPGILGSGSWDGLNRVEIRAGPSAQSATNGPEVAQAPLLQKTRLFYQPKRGSQVPKADCLAVAGLSDSSWQPAFSEREAGYPQNSKLPLFTRAIGS
jgi:hypothetical protein